MSEFVLDIENFRGLKGARQYKFEKLNAITGPMGTGKSSVIDALKFALTGIEPVGEMINSGADRCSVCITFPSGKKFKRIKYRDSRPAKYYTDDKPSTLAKMNEELQQEFGGVQIGNARLIASGEMLAAIDTKRFGDLVLSYMPETMETDDIINILTVKSDYISAVVKDVFPAGEFGVESIDAAYSTCMERRRLLRGKIKELETIIMSNGGLQEINGNIVDLQQQLMYLRARRDEQVVLAQKRNEYNRAEAALRRFKETVARLEDEVGKISANFHSEEERRSAALVLEAHRATITASYSAVNSAKANEKALTEAIKNITQPVCPLSPKLVCTTDKTKIVNDMTSNLMEVKKQLEFQKNQLANARKKEEEAEARIRVIDRENAEYRRKEGLIKQLEEMRKAEPAVPEMPPEAADIRLIDLEIERITRAISSFKVSKKMEEYAQRRDNYVKRLESYEYLVQAFSPKGEVKKSITEMYLKEFEVPCNEKAERIFDKMQIRFTAENGVTIYCDTEGLGNFVSFQSLSAGEKVAVTFIIVLTLAFISGFGIVLMDELSVLDKKTFERLIETIKAAKDEYAMTVIACVDHTDTDRILKEEGISQLKAADLSSANSPGS